MMPNYQHMANYQTWQCSIVRKNGLQKQSGKTTNGRLKRELSDSEEHEYIQFSSPDSVSEQQCNLEGEELVKILEKDSKNLEAVSKFVLKHKNMSIKWPNSDFYLRLCDLSGTIYMGQKFMQEAWEELYLPKKTRMQVFGTLENSQVMLPTVQWIILVGEDGFIYAYGEEELQLIARSLREFEQNGKRNIHTYYPESSDEEDEFLQHDAEVQDIRKRTRSFVNKSANEFDDFLGFLSS